MKQALRSFILENFMFGASPADLDDDVSLVDSGILDSTSVLELLAHLEQRYGIAVDATDLTPENLDSVNRLKTFLERKGAGVGA